jgi:hypothetical protein
MELLARAFECHPTASRAYSVVAPLVDRLGDVPFTGRIGAKNSGQWDSDLDDRLAECFWSMPGNQRTEFNHPALKKKCDFAFVLDGISVVVEVEKANWEKVLYDFLKAHIYFASGADLVVIFAPKNYVHSASRPTKSFAKACQRYDHCIQFEFGTVEKLSRILLVGYEVALGDGRLLTPTLRTQFIQQARQAAFS